MLLETTATVNDSFFPFHLQIYRKIKKHSLRDQIRALAFGSSIGKNLLCIAYKKGGIEEIKSTQIEFFSLIDYIYLTYRYNLDEYMIVLIRKHNN